MKKLACMLLALLTCCMAAGAAAAGETLPDTEEETLVHALPAGQRRYLDGVRLESADKLAAAFAQLLENMSSDAREAVQGGIAGLVRVAVVVIITAAARGFSAAAGGEADAAIDMAGALGCAAVLLRDFSGVLSLCRETLAQISVFSGTLQPVLAAVLASGGSTATATALQAAAVVIFDLVIRLVNRLLIPAVCAYLGIVTANAATANGMLQGISNGIRDLTAGALKLILTLFTAYLTIAGGVSGSVDRIALKTAKFAVSGAVPVVGSVISDAAETVLTGAALLKNSIGLFGMLCVTAICLVPFLRVGAGYLCYKAGAAAFSPLCAGGLRQLLDGIGTGFGLLLGMLSTCCMILYLELVYVVAMVKPV